MSDPFVVKAQTSLASSDGNAHVLIYDNSGSVTHEDFATPEMVKEIGERSFWWAVLNDNGIIELQKKSTEVEFHKFDFISMNPKETK